jgi:hypothetical protein
MMAKSWVAIGKQHERGLASKSRIPNCLTVWDFLNVHANKHSFIHENHPMIKLRIFAILFVVVAVIAGCQESGNPNAPAKVMGKVTYKGTPVTAGTLTFHGKDGSINNCDISPDGTYSVSNFPEGEMTVTINNELYNPNRKQVDYKGGAGGAGAAGMYKKAAAGPAGGTNKGKAEMSPTPEGATGLAGAYVKLPAKYAKKETSDIKVTLVKGENKKDIDFVD